MTNTVLILGCGDIGQRIARRLPANTTVYGVRRNIELLDARINGIEADLSTSNLIEAFKELPKKLAAIMIIMTPAERSSAGYRQAYIENPNRARLALEALGITINRVVFVSSTSVYGQSESEWVDETSETKPKSETAKVLLEAEKTIKTTWQASALIVRSSGIYGEGRERFIRRVIEGVRYPIRPELYSNRIHQDDLAAAIIWLNAQSRVCGTYIVSDSLPTTLYDVQQWLIGKMPLLLQGQIIEPPITAGSKRLDNSRLLTTGFQLQYPSYKEGYLPLIGRKEE